MRIDVINPWGRDAAIDWRNGLPPPGAPGHPPINYWAWAAATGGAFHQTPDTVTSDAEAVVQLLRWRGGVNLRALKQMKARGLRVFVTWKESGVAQIAGQLRWPWRRSALRAVLQLADGAIATTEPGCQHYRDYGLPPEKIHFIPTPYPIGEPGWDFTRPLVERAGIVVGTRQFDVPSRRHAEALLLAGEIARAAGCAVTVFNPEGERGRARVQRHLGVVPEIRWIERRLPYPEFLAELARHRLVIQRDAGWVPGQIAGDALLCGLINIGGNGATQRLAFPATAEPEADEATLLSSAVTLMRDDAAFIKAVEDSRSRAETTGLSYRSGREKWAASLNA